VKSVVRRAVFLCKKVATQTGMTHEMVMEVRRVVFIIQLSGDLDEEHSMGGGVNPLYSMSKIQLSGDLDEEHSMSGGVNPRYSMSKIQLSGDLD
jgi:hypothetical protein